MLGAKTAGNGAMLDKVCSWRRVVGIVDVEPHEGGDRVIMVGLPMAHDLEIEEILWLRGNERFAGDVKRRWK